MGPGRGGGLGGEESKWLKYGEKAARVKSSLACLGGHFRVRAKASGRCRCKGSWRLHPKSQVGSGPALEASDTGPTFMDSFDFVKPVTIREVKNGGGCQGAGDTCGMF